MRICDRCGKECAPNDAERMTLFFNAQGAAFDAWVPDGNGSLEYIGGGGRPSEPADLCGECAKELRDWIDGVRELSDAGEWKINSQESTEKITIWTCSVCDCLALQKYRCCPNCGARMQNGDFQILIRRRSE